MSASLRVLREEPKLRWLLSATFISGVGDWFNTVAVLSLLLALTGSGLAVGITLALRVVPRLLVGPLAGVLADRAPRKTVLIATDVASGILALSFLFVTSASSVWIVYASTTALVISSILHAPARGSALPSLVRADNLLSANALEQTAMGSVMVVGSVAGGLATAAFGVRVAFVLNALSFALSALLTLPIRFPQLERSARSGVAAAVEIWPVIRRSRLVRIELLLSVLWPLGGGTINVLISVYAFNVFGAGNTGVGVLYGALGMGLVLGGMLAHRVSRWVRQAAALGLIVEGCGHIVVSQSPTLAVAAGALALATIGAGVGNASISYLLMRSVAGHQLGRVLALSATVSGVTMALSMLLGGVLLRVVSARTLGLAAGALIVGTGVAGGWLLLRTALPAPADVDEGAVAVA